MAEKKVTIREQHIKQLEDHKLLDALARDLASSLSELKRFLDLNRGQNNAVDRALDLAAITLDHARANGLLK